MTTAKMTEAESAALIANLEANGYEYAGGWGICCDFDGDHSGGTWRNDSERVSIEWLHPRRGGDVVATVHRSPR